MRAAQPRLRNFLAVDEDFETISSLGFETSCLGSATLPEELDRAESIPLDAAMSFVREGGETCKCVELSRERKMAFERRQAGQNRLAEKRIFAQ